MVTQKVTVTNPSGLHARPAAVLAKAAGTCKSNAVILYGGKKIQIKSILSIMGAGIKKGAEVEVQCDGETEKEDLNMLVELIKSGLGE